MLVTKCHNTLSNADTAGEPLRKKQKPHEPTAELDDAVADFFYGTGTPLHYSRCEALHVWEDLTLHPLIVP